jgi:hypothetical protein
MTRTVLGEYPFGGKSFSLGLVHPSDDGKEGEEGGKNGWYLAASDIARLFANAESLNPMVMKDKRVQAQMIQDPINSEPCIERSMLRDLAASWNFEKLKRLSRFGLTELINVSLPTANRNPDVLPAVHEAMHLLESLKIRLRYPERSGGVVEGAKSDSQEPRGSSNPESKPSERDGTDEGDTRRSSLPTLPQQSNDDGKRSSDSSPAKLEDSNQNPQTQGGAPNDDSVEAQRMKLRRQSATEYDVFPFTYQLIFNLSALLKIWSWNRFFA